MNLTTIPFLTTAIAIVICWGLFAIFCSLVQEAITQAKAERGKFLKKYILQQLQDVSNGINWGSLLYMHGSVDMLSRDYKKPTSFIPSRLFAETMVDVVANSQLVQMNAGLNIPKKYTNTLLNNFNIAVETLNPSDVVSLFKSSLQSADVSSTNEAEVYKALVDKIEYWYQGLQDKVTLWYKKKTRVRLFILGVILGAIFNIDSIQLLKYFSTEPAASEAIINYYQQNENTISGYVAKAEQGDTAKERNVVALMQEANKFAQKMDTLKEIVQLPIGWSSSPFCVKKTAATGTASKSSCETDWFGIFLKILGICITGFAASFGAPFWFDLLKKTYSKAK